MNLSIGPEVVAAGVSVVALAIAIYGVWEKRESAAAAECLRLATVADQISAALHEAGVLKMNGAAFGDLIVNLNSRIEQLADEGYELIVKHQSRIYSSVCRTIAFGADTAGDVERSECIWSVAIDLAHQEGDAQRRNAHRGFAFFLIRNGWAAEGRHHIEKALALIDLRDDEGVADYGGTLASWAINEWRDPGQQAVIGARLQALTDQCQYPQGRARVDALVAGLTSAGVVVAAPS